MLDEDVTLANWSSDMARDTKRYRDIPRYTQVYPDIRFWGWYINGISGYMLVYLDNRVSRYTKIYRDIPLIYHPQNGISGYIWVYPGISWFLFSSVFQFAIFTSLSSSCRKLDIPNFVLTWQCQLRSLRRAICLCCGCPHKALPPALKEPWC